MSNQQSSFHIIDLKLDDKPSLILQCSGVLLQHAAWWSQLVECSDKYLCTGGAYRNRSGVSKQAPSGSITSTFFIP